MMCEACHKCAAVVHLGATASSDGAEQYVDTHEWEHHFCKDCADEYFARTPGMNSSRDLICLSDWYRFKLYDLLESAHPEAFDDDDAEACQRSSDLMSRFLREQLTRAGIDLNEDGWEMLCSDFFSSHHFYARAEEFKRRKG
jgi:hypothetical protein